MNHLFKAADDYYRMAYEFKQAGLKGFYKFAKHESKERWHMGDCIAKYICRHDQVPKFAQVMSDNMGNNIANAPMAMKKMSETETIITNMISEQIANLTPETMWALGKMTELLEWCMKEKTEVAMVEKRAGMPGSSVIEIDGWLYEKYSK